MFSTEVLIIGGGPAGLAAAIAVRRHGFRVTVADARRPPIDKACGEGLMPDSLQAARALGVDIPANRGHRFYGIRFAGAGTSVQANFPEGYGLGVRRLALHQLLIDHAEQAGVDFAWGRTVNLDADTSRARWIIGADGAASAVRRWAKLDMGSQTRRFGFRQHYAIAPWSRCMELYWGCGCQFYVTPVGPQEVCVVLMSRNPYLRQEKALSAFPELAAQLSGVAPVTKEWGAISGSLRLRSVIAGNVALIGDASAYADAITGDGLYLAFRQADALGRALAAGDLQRYQVEHRQLVRRPAFMGKLMLLLEGQALQYAGMRMLAASPAIFRNLLALHVGISVGHLLQNPAR